MDLSRFTDEQKAKIKACKTPEELMALADAEDFELSPDELEAVSGGGSWDEDPSTDKTHQLYVQPDAFVIGLLFTQLQVPVTITKLLSLVTIP